MMGIKFLYLLPLLLLPALTSANDLRVLHELFLVPPEPLILDYHKGALLTGNYSINIVWYGDFTAAQRGIIADFIKSLSASTPAPSVASWWKTTSLYKGGGATITLGRQVFDTKLSFGKSLSRANLSKIATNNGGPHKNSVTAIFTAPDILVEAFCQVSCGLHKWAVAGKQNGTKFPYLWAGNPATQCPGGCAWPFYKPIYGPQNFKPLIPPNGDVGMDGLIIRLATLLAGAATNPYGDGYYQGDKLAPLEAVTACPGAFGTGYYSGYPGKLLIDKTTGASYNAVGIGSRKYLIPGMWNPTTKQCTPLV